MYNIVNTKMIHYDISVALERQNVNLLLNLLLKYYCTFNVYFNACIFKCIYFAA